MVTISYSSLMLTLLVVCAVVLTVGSLIALFRMASAATRLQRWIDRVEPDVDEVLREGRATLHSAREVVDRAELIADDVEAVTSETRKAALPLVWEVAGTVNDAMIPLRHLSALMMGARAGLSALTRDNGSRDEPR